MNNIPYLLIQRLQQKKKLLDQNDPKHKEIKTALVIDGGAMKGAWAAGVVSALQELSFNNIFDIVVAVSSGTIVVPYFLTGEANIAPEVFYKYLASKEFINITKLHPQKIVGVDYINKVFLHYLPFKENLLKKSQTQIFIGVTNPDTGAGEYLNMRKENIPFLDAIHASSAVPFLHNKMVSIHGKAYLDGMIGCGIPIAPALRQNCTDILVIENNPIGHPPFVNKLLIKMLFMFFKSKITPETRKAILERKKRYIETLHEIKQAKEEGINIGIIAPNKTMVSPLSINKKQLQYTSDEAKKLTIDFFHKFHE